ncbi:MAG: nitronate monooxygenase [Opitutaceae bacterium]|nr:nitronate monooxygenase [Cytophagales bacterium]
MNYNNRICSLFDIRIPIIQAGMVWCSGWKLASAVSEAGGLGLIGAGSMNSEVLKEHILKTQKATTKPFGVNLPLIYSDIDKHIDVILETGVKIVFTSAGNPVKYTSMLKQNGLTVIHVVSGLKYALKAQDAGVDAIVGEGFEAGGHNGRDETTTLCLMQLLLDKIRIPVIAAGGLYSGRSMLAALALGAEGVQIGSRFAVCTESSAHDNFKQAVIESQEGETDLILKSLIPVRMLKNEFYTLLKNAEVNGANPAELKTILGKGRSKKGIFEGDTKEGELEIGQVSALIYKRESAKDIVEEIWNEFLERKAQISLL